MKNLTVLLTLLLLSFGISAQTIAEISNIRKISATQGGFSGQLDAGDLFSRGVAIGDIDGDGIEDLAVGAEHDDDGFTNAGAVWILFMNENRSVKGHQKISATSGWPNAPLVGGSFGKSLASIGDFDHDGVPDIVVSSYYDNDGGSKCGAVYILLLNRNGTVKSHQKISATKGGLYGLTSNRLFGSGVCSLGDLDGDGITDIAVGAPNYDNDGGLYKGSVWILFLNQNGTVKNQQIISQTQGNLHQYLNNDDRFGATVYNIGDIDGDGIDEITVSAWGDDDGAYNAGAFYILFLNRNGTVNRSQKISAFYGNFTGMVYSNDNFGYSSTGLGDVDGDGINDIAVGVFNSDYYGTDKGKVYIMYLNRDGTIKEHVHIAEIGDYLTNGDGFGIELSTFKGYNQLGKKEIIISVFKDDDGATDAGAVYIIDLDVKHKPVAQAGDNQHICGGSQITLDASASTVLDNDPLSYYWECTELDIVSQDSVLNVDIPFVAQFTTFHFLLTVTCQGIASEKDTVSVTVNPNPGKPVISFSENILTSTEADSYQWYFNDEVIENATNLSYTPVENGNYQVVVGNELGCISEESNVIIVSSPPVAVISGSAIACSGSTFNLNGQSSYEINTKEYNLSYLWSSDDIVINNNLSDVITIFVPDSNEVYNILIKLHVMNDRLESNIDSFLVTVYPIPAKPQIFESGDTLYTSSAIAYEWYLNNTLIPNTNLQHFYPNSNGNYSVIFQNVYGCVSDISAPYLVEKIPIAVTNGSSIACSGSAIFLNANSSYLPNQTIADLEYQWSSNTMVISNNSLNELMLVAPKVESTTQIEFYLQVFNNDLGSEIDTFIVTVIPAPATPSIEQFADTLLATLANNYQWYNDGSEVNGATDSTLIIEQSGNYQVKIINEWGCVSDISVPVAFTKTSINTKSNQVKVFPNPTNDIINIVGLDQSKKVSIFVYDQLGHLSDQVTSENGIAIIDLKQQKRGIYFIHIENQHEAIKILKE